MLLMQRSKTNTLSNKPTRHRTILRSPIEIAIDTIDDENAENDSEIANPRTQTSPNIAHSTITAHPQTDIIINDHHHNHPHHIHHTNHTHISLLNNKTHKKAFPKSLKRAIMRLLIEISIFMLILWFLNCFAAELIIKLVTQFTVGWGSNIMIKNYNLIDKPNQTLAFCSQSLHSNYLKYQRVYHSHLNIADNNLQIIKQREHALKRLSVENRFYSPPNLNNATNHIVDQLLYLNGTYSKLHSNLNECHKIKKNTLQIPRIIHQTYKTFESIPDEWKQTPQKWQSLHPDWTYMFWSDMDIDLFIHKFYSSPLHYSAILDSYPHNIQKVDAVRYFILYHFGGVYIDMDIQPTKNIESLISNKDHLLVETPNIGLTNAVMGSKKNSNLMKYVIDHLHAYKYSWYSGFLPTHLQILTSSGPTFFWCVVSKFIELQMTEWYKENFEVENVGVIGNEYYNLLGDCESINIYEDSAYFHHLRGLSWHLGNSWIISRYLHCHPILIFGSVIAVVYALFRCCKIVQQFKLNKKYILMALVLLVLMGYVCVEEYF